MTTTSDTPAGRDGGFTLIELVIAVVILGVLGAAVMISVTGLTTEAADTGCLADRHQLTVSFEAYVAQIGSRRVTATGGDHDRFEHALVTGGFLRSPSSLHDIDANGVIAPEEGSSC